jgi:hypothetical protein
MTLVEWIAFVASLATLVSVSINVVQRRTRLANEKALRAEVQANFNTFCNIARQSSRGRDLKGGDANRLENSIRRLEVIRGCADTARTHLIAHGRETLGIVPFYEHPAFPGIEQREDVVLGATPDEVRRTDDGPEADE